MRLNNYRSCDGSNCYTVYADVDHFQTIRYSLTGVFFFLIKKVIIYVLQAEVIWHYL